MPKFELKKKKKGKVTPTPSDVTDSASEREDPTTNDFQAAAPAADSAPAEAPPAADAPADAAPAENSDGKPAEGKTDTPTGEGGAVLCCSII